MSITEQPVCRYCGSPNIMVDAFARWDVEAQEWTLSSTLDECICGECGEEGRPSWEVVK